MNGNYEAPKLTQVGSVEALTSGLRTGSSLDKTFPAGTNFGQLTFS